MGGRRRGGRRRTRRGRRRGWPRGRRRRRGDHWGGPRRASGRLPLGGSASPAGLPRGRRRRDAGSSPPGMRLPRRRSGVASRPPHPRIARGRANDASRSDAEGRRRRSERATRRRRRLHERPRPRDVRRACAHVPRQVRRKEPFRRGEEVRAAARRDFERDDGAAAQGPIGRQRRPPHEPRADPPLNPRAGVLIARHPRPADGRQRDPATIMEGDPSPGIVADPRPPGLVVGPVSSRQVRLEAGSDRRRGRNPDRAVRGVVDPASVLLECPAEVAERCRIDPRARRRIIRFVRRGLRRRRAVGRLRVRVTWIRRRVRLTRGLGTAVRGRREQERRGEQSDQTGRGATRTHTSIVLAAASPGTPRPLCRKRSCNGASGRDHRAVSTTSADCRPSEVATSRIVPAAPRSGRTIARQRPPKACLWLA